MHAGGAAAAAGGATRVPTPAGANAVGANGRYCHPGGRALSSAWLYPPSGWVPASEPGSADLLERRERRRAQRYARSRTPTRAHLGSLEPSARTRMLTHACAPDSQALPAHRRHRHRRLTRCRSRRSHSHPAASIVVAAPLRHVLSWLCPLRRKAASSGSGFARSWAFFRWGMR